MLNLISIHRKINLKSVLFLWAISLLMLFPITATANMNGGLHFSPLQIFLIILIFVLIFGTPVIALILFIVWRVRKRYRMYVFLQGLAFAMFLIAFNYSSFDRYFQYNQFFDFYFLIFYYQIASILLFGLLAVYRPLPEELDKKNNWMKRLFNRPGRPPLIALSGIYFLSLSLNSVFFYWFYMDSLVFDYHTITGFILLLLTSFSSYGILFNKKWRDILVYSNVTITLLLIIINSLITKFPLHFSTLFSVAISVGILLLFVYHRKKNRNENRQQRT